MIAKIILTYREISEFIKNNPESEKNNPDESISILYSDRVFGRLFFASMLAAAIHASDKMSFLVYLQYFNFALESFVFLGIGGLYYSWRAIKFSPVSLPDKTNALGINKLILRGLLRVLFWSIYFSLTSSTYVYFDGHPFRDIGLLLTIFFPLVLFIRDKQKIIDEDKKSHH